MELSGYNWMNNVEHPNVTQKMIELNPTATQDASGQYG